MPDQMQWRKTTTYRLLQLKGISEVVLYTLLDAVKIALMSFRCDLAGSERVKKAGVERERLAELQHVNLSLLELGWVALACARQVTYLARSLSQFSFPDLFFLSSNTIHALSEGKRTHIPYRNSSLTRLLQDSLGGNCKTSFVVRFLNKNPRNHTDYEKINTIRYVERLRENVC